METKNDHTFYKNIENIRNYKIIKMLILRQTGLTRTSQELQN